MTRIADLTEHELHEFADRHERIALLFSAGKDSGACLKLLRPYIAKVTVIWANPGDAYPETENYMAAVRDNVPVFVEAKGDQPAFVRSRGYPVDMLPFESTPVGRVAAADEPEMKLVLLNECCAWNMWIPLWNALKASKATGCVRGDKHADAWRPKIGNRELVDGVEYHLPLRAWSDDEVVEYLGELLPASYRRGHQASFDCMSCTAYTHHNPGRLRELAALHPEKFEEVRPVLWHLRKKAFHFLTDLQGELA